MTDELVIATRKSALALWQAEFVANALRQAHPGLAVRLAPMSTQGDRWLSSPLSEVGGKGLFIKELEAAMLDGRAHLAVHSMKDVPAVLPDGFMLSAIGYRDEVRDALVHPQHVSLDNLPQGARIGSSSLRRQAMLRARRPDLDIRPVRGNVGTRLKKLDDGEFDALILAHTGLARLGLGDRITESLDTHWCVPAAGQGALGIETVAADTQTAKLVAALDDAGVRACVEAERAVSAGLEAGCSTPLGAYAQWQGDQIALVAVLGSVDGQRLLRIEAEGGDPAALGAQVAERLFAAGARDILTQLDDDAASPS